VHSFDQRGWGRSVKKQSEKGLTGPTPTVLGDLDSFIKSKLPAPAPLFLMGHSMGGQECLMFASTGPSETTKHITGFMAEAPYIRLDGSSQPSSFTIFAGRIASKMLPHHQMVQKLHPEYMCHDEAMCKDWELDPLCHHTGTLEGLGGMLDRAAALDKGEVGLSEEKPLFIGHGTGDKVTSHEASKRFFERSKAKDKTIKFYDGCYHCSKYGSSKLQMADLTLL
jgi:acylglycerol lipase